MPPTWTEAVCNLGYNRAACQDFATDFSILGPVRRVAQCHGAHSCSASLSMCHRRGRLGGRRASGRHDLARRIDGTCRGTTGHRTWTAFHQGRAPLKRPHRWQIVVRRLTFGRATVRLFLGFARHALLKPFLVLLKLAQFIRGKELAS